MGGGGSSNDGSEGMFDYVKTNKARVTPPETDAVDLNRCAINCDYDYNEEDTAEPHNNSDN